MSGRLVLATQAAARGTNALRFHSASVQGGAQLCSSEIIPRTEWSPTRSNWLKLAQTGEFEDATSIERELISAGFSTFEVLALNAPAVRFMIDGACDSGRRDEQRSPQQR
jgi:hypothetical protein